MKKEIINTEAVAFLTKLDSQFELIVDTYGLPPSWSREEGFESLCRIILEQQVSLESGKAAYDKLSLLVDSFSPMHISELSIEQMRAASVSRQKAGYILGLAQKILDRDINIQKLGSLDTEGAIVELIKIKGIGPWTAEVYVLFALQAPDIYPRGDIALINTIKELWGVENATKAEEKAKDWSPYRSCASYLLWHYYLSKRGRVSPI